MAAKPFIAARIPEDIDKKLEEHTKSTGESRTQALINALATYLGCIPEREEKGASTDRLTSLEKRVEELEKLVKTPKQTSLFDDEVVIATDNTMLSKSEKEDDSDVINPDNKSDNQEDNKPKADNKSDNKEDNGLQTSDNETENDFDNAIGDEFKFIGTMKSLEFRNLPDLKGMNREKLKNKVNNTKNAKNQTAVIGPYKIRFAGYEAGSKGKRQELLWDVFKLSED